MAHKNQSRRFEFEVKIRLRAESEAKFGVIKKCILAVLIPLLAKLALHWIGWG
jgi:hypothetical protein